MQAAYDKIAIDNCWSSRASSPDVNTATVSPAINKDPVMHGTATHKWIPRLSQMLVQKCDIFLLIMDSPAGLY